MIHFPFDFPMTHPSVGTSLYCIIMYAVCCIISYNKSKAYNLDAINRLSKKYIRGYILLVGFLFITYCLNGDFFHLMENVHNYVYVDGFHNYGEPIYQTIGQFVSSNYLLFRTIVWGGAFFAFVMTAKRMKIPVYLAVSILCLCYSVTFSYGRVTAAIAIYFLGLSFFCCPIRFEILSYAIGGIIMLFSWQFHTSGLIMLIMTAILFLPVKRWSIWCVIVLIPVAAAIGKDLFFIFALDDETDEFIANKMLSYSDREVRAGIAKYLLNLFNYSAFLIPLYISYKTIFVKNKLKNIDAGIIRMFKVTFGLTYTAVSFLLFGETFFTFFYRILNMTMIPIVIIVVGLYYYHNMSRRDFIHAIIPGFLYSTYHLAYMFYLNL